MAKRMEIIYEDKHWNDYPEMKVIVMKLLTFDSNLRLNWSELKSSKFYSQL